MELRRKHMFSIVTIMCITNIIFITGINEDKVCYLADSTPACHRHQLGCVRDEIAILSAEYAYTTDCTCVRRKCRTCRSGDRDVALQPSAKCANDYYPEDYLKVITTCSKRNLCFFPVCSQRYYNECSSKTAFSYIRYRCVDATYEVNMCGGDEQVGQYVSLFYDGSSPVNASQHCVCTISGHDPQSTDTYNITALDIRMRDDGDQESSRLTLKSQDIEDIIKTDIRPNTPLLRTRLSFTSEVKLDFKSNHTPERIWILIEGQENSEIQARCETVMPPVTIGNDVLEDKGVSHMPEMPIAAIGGTVGSLVLLVLLFLVVCFCRRKTPAQTRISTKYREDEVTTKTGAEHEYFVVEVRTEVPNPQNMIVPNHPGILLVNPGSVGSEWTSNEPQYADIDMATGECEGPIVKDYDDVCVQTSNDKQENNYNCLVTSNSGHKMVEAHYDTTASASKVVQELESQEHYYSYDHLGASAPLEVTDNDYDTTFVSS